MLCSALLLSPLSSCLIANVKSSMVGLPDELAPDIHSGLGLPSPVAASNSNTCSLGLLTARPLRLRSTTSTNRVIKRCLLATCVDSSMRIEVCKTPVREVRVPKTARLSPLTTNRLQASLPQTPAVTTPLVTAIPYSSSVECSSRQAALRVLRASCTSNAACSALSCGISAVVWMAFHETSRRCLGKLEGWSNPAEDWMALWTASVTFEYMLQATSLPICFPRVSKLNTSRHSMATGRSFTPTWVSCSSVSIFGALGAARAPIGTTASTASLSGTTRLTFKLCMFTSAGSEASVTLGSRGCPSTGCWGRSTIPCMKRWSERNGR
mmetsp:Transcript_136514/g.236894  ORF Transcript_136514/g.236894 Transcript_136514/m.236894 type:complete len:324 (-) Transcript_136514:4291-5262(-)